MFPRRQEHRRAARRRLAKNLAASRVDDGRIVEWRHYCPIGCHDSRQSAIDEIVQDMRIAHLDLHVPVPAVNRWTKLYAPLSYFHVGSFFGHLPASFQALSKNLSKESGVLDVDALVGPGDEDTYEQKRKVRANKCAAWMSRETTRHQQAVGISTLKPAISLMGKFFEEAKLTKSGNGSANEFCIRATSPAHATLHRYFDLLGQPEAIFWLPVRGSGIWSQHCLKLVASAVYFSVGSVHHRLVRPFESWPWPLAKLVSELTSTAEKDEVVEAFMAKDTECCFDRGFGWLLRSKACVVVRCIVQCSWGLFGHRGSCCHRGASRFASGCFSLFIVSDYKYIWVSRALQFIAQWCHRWLAQMSCARPLTSAV